MKIRPIGHKTMYNNKQLDNISLVWKGQSKCGVGIFASGYVDRIIAGVDLRIEDQQTTIDIFRAIL